MARSLTSKFTIPSFLVLLLLAITGCIGIYDAVSSRTAIERLTHNALDRAILNASLDNELAYAIMAAQAFMMTGDQKGRQDAEHALQRAEEQLDELQKVVQERNSVIDVDNEQSHKIQQQRRERVLQVRQIVANMIVAHKADDQETIQSLLQELDQIAQTHQEMQAEVEALLLNDVNIAENYVDERFQNAIFAVALAIVSFMLLTLLALVGLRRYVVQPINQLSTAANKVAHGDLNQIIPVTSDDEIGELQQSFNQMVANLRTKQAMQDTFEGELKRMAFHDPLCHLPNRALFIDRLKHALDLTQRHNTSVAVLFLDLDNFKVINDSLGHQIGDQLIVTVARRLQKCMRTQDTVARLGGDEFAILLEDIVDPQEAVAVAERIQEHLRVPVMLGVHEIVPTTSIGIATGRSPGADPDTLLRDADLAMYRAKNQGKAGYQVFEPSMNTQADERLDLEGDLRRAIRQSELELYYQPVINLDDGSIASVEALVRWQHPQRGLVSPASFIPLAEETGLILPLGQWVLQTACHQIHEWQTVAPDMAPCLISVNLSARQFKDPNLVDMIAKTLEESGLSPSCLELEITESCVMENGATTLSVLEALKGLGVRLAIDDFGTGYSSLAYLERFPLDTLKIDRSFMGRLDRDTEDTAIVRAIITLAHSLGLQVTGEGVETEAQLDRLLTLGCNFVQGYYFSRPLPTPAIEQFFATPVSRLSHAI